MRLLYDKKITSFYDDFTLSGYYDYGKEVEVIKEIVGERKNLLELGSGTGNLLILLAKAGFEVTGLDNSAPMLRELEKKRKKENFTFPNILADQRKLSLGKKFDVIVSSGGLVWFVTFEDEIFVATYDPSFKGIQQTFAKAYEHLNPGGLLLLNIQHHGRKFSLRLRNGMDYHFEITQKSPTKIVKSHFVEKEGKLVFTRAFPQRIFPVKRALEAAKAAGFKVLGQDETKSFYIFEK